MSPGSVDAAGSGTGVDASADDVDPILEAVNKLGPGDMVFAKFARYPWWPAIIVPCNQRKHKHADQHRVGGEDPKLARFWVQFFNENSGAFVLLKNIFPFNPLELDKYVCAKTSSHFEEQKKAFEMARDDFYVMNPDFPRPAGEAAPTAPEENVDTAGGDSEDDAKIVKKKPGRPAKRKPAKSASVKGVKTKRARITKPDTQEFGSVSSESGDEADPEDDPEAVPMAVSHEAENAYEPNDESAGDSDEAILPPSKPKKSAKASAVKKSTKAAALKEAKKEKASAADKQKIKSLQRQVKVMRAELAEEKTAHDLSRRRTSELERKLKKAKHMQKSVEKVKVLLPEVADALPDEIPLESERATKKLGAGEFQTLGARTHSAFSEYEALVKECGGLHNAVLDAAKDAESQLQRSWDEMASSMTNMENLERKLAGLLRELYCADIRSDNGPDEALMQTVTKIVKRIHRRVRVGDNSGLVLGRAFAVIESWEKEASKTRPPAEASGKETKDEPNVSGASPEANSTSDKVASEVDTKDNEVPSSDVADGHVGTEKKDSMSSDDQTQVAREEEKSACVQEDKNDSKEDRQARTNTEEKDGEGETSEHSGGDKSGSGEKEEPTSDGSASEGNRIVVSSTDVSKALPGDEKRDGDVKDDGATTTDGRKDVKMGSDHDQKPSALSSAEESGDGE